MARNKGPYIFGNRRFATKSEAESAIREVLYRYEAGNELVGADEELIAAVLIQHPHARDKIGAGVQRIRVRLVNEWGKKGRCFEIVRIDGSVTDFSFQKALHPASKRQLFKEACRDLISKEIMDFRHRAFDTSGEDGRIDCPVTGDRISRMEESHVDHDPPFDELVEALIQSEGIDIESVILSGSEDGELRKSFQDQELAQKWRAYHRTHARLRVVSKRANLSVLKRNAG